MNDVASVYYVDSLGRTFDFMVDRDDITNFQNESGKYYAGRLLTAGFHSFEWKPETYDSLFGDRVLGWTKDSKTYQATLLFGGSYTERADALDLFHEAIENDIRNENPGTLHWNDWRVECFITSSDTKPSKEDRGSTENIIDIYCPKGLWRKRRSFTFISQEIEADDSTESFIWNYNWSSELARFTDKKTFTSYPFVYNTLNTITDVEGITLTKIVEDPESELSPITTDTITLTSSDYTYTTNSVTIESADVSSWASDTYSDTREVPREEEFDDQPVVGLLYKSPYIGLDFRPYLSSLVLAGPEYLNPGWVETYILTSDTVVDPEKIYYELVSSQYEPVTPVGNENPSQEGWYEIDEDGKYLRETYTLTGEGTDWALMERPEGDYVQIRTNVSGVASFITGYDYSQISLIFTLDGNQIVGELVYENYEYFPPETQGGDYEYDYLGEAIREGAITNPLPYDIDWECIINGPIEGPTIIIGDDLVIEMDLIINSDEYLTVNSIDKTIILTDSVGNRMNVFGYRDTSNYIFEKIPSGTHRATWDGDYEWSMELIEERSEPEWDANE